MENYIAGGLDTVIVNKINYWPNDKDEILLVCNKSHEGLEKILKKQIKRPFRLVLSPVKTVTDISNKYLPRQHVMLRRCFQVPSLLFWFYARYLLSLYNFPKLYMLFKQLKPDAVFIHNGGYPAADSARVAVIAAAMANVKKIFMIIHNLAVKPWLFNLPFEYAIDKMMDKYCRLICVSEVAKETLMKKRYIKQDVLVIHNGITDSENLPKNRILELKDDLGIPPSCKCVGIVSSYESRKGHEDLFSAINILKTKYKINNVKCLVFGKGSPIEQQRINNFIDRYGLGKEVILCGFKTDVLKYFYLFDVYVSSSKEYESFPISILEAMAPGVPVIATDVGGVREMVVDGKTGFIVPPNRPEDLGEKLSELLTNRTRASLMGNEAKQRFKLYFRAGVMAREYCNLL
jgi:glycosyltransferase involved in cell wall biosynthesis